MCRFSAWTRTSGRWPRNRRHSLKSRQIRSSSTPRSPVNCASKPATPSFSTSKNRPCCPSKPPSRRRKTSRRAFASVSRGRFGRAIRSIRFAGQSSLANERLPPAGVSPSQSRSARPGKSPFDRRAVARHCSATGSWLTPISNSATFPTALNCAQAAFFIDPAHGSRRDINRLEQRIGLDLFRERTSRRRKNRRPIRWSQPPLPRSFPATCATTKSSSANGWPMICRPNPETNSR